MPSCCGQWWMQSRILPFIHTIRRGTIGVHCRAYNLFAKPRILSERTRHVICFIGASCTKPITHHIYLDSLRIRNLTTDGVKGNTDNSASSAAWHNRYIGEFILCSSGHFHNQRCNSQLAFSIELIKYIETNGNALVPRDNKNNVPLGRWVDKQRCFYKTNELSPERVQILNDIGFVWEPQEVQWSERYNELLEYIKRHGNALVPQNYIDNITLGNWTQKQRYNYKTNVLSDDRIQKLNDVGFVWDVLEAQWLERLEELKKYKREHGDTLVPRNHPIGSWVWWQRRDYKIYLEKRKLGDESHNLDSKEVKRIEKLSTGANEKRIQMLEDVDFIWDPKEYLWNLKYEELREWISLNGDGAIRTSKKNNNSLETWATRQRKLYQQCCDGQVTSLTKERIDKLRAIGFVFELRKYPR